ncbi:MAG: phosphoenolpyruvate carboxykinase (ATP), partial [Gemmatimonadetes bacterium]|nr:phosphoenolpyruvate carboxykinase (ATP) [Gemmatimonadota bacterium]
MAANTYTETEPQLVPGLAPTEKVYHNLQPAALYEIAIRAEEGQVAYGGAFCTITAPHTGRSPKDKFIVRDAGSADDIWWGKVNQPISPDRWKVLRADVLAHLGSQPLHVQDLFAGADPAVRVPVRFITPNAWHALFVRNMFIRPP